MYDYLIVGAGLYGAVFAHEMKEKGKSCLILEKRDHVGGNIYTELLEGIHVHTYGAHIFHTNDREVWDYVNRFAEFNRYTNSPVANFKGEIYNLPFNMNTFSKMWGVFTPEEAKKKIEEQKMAALSDLAGVTSDDSSEEAKAKMDAFTPSNLEEQAISLIGTDIYEKLINGYTQKQWGRPCRELPSFIIKRLPVRFIYDNNYFNALFQGIPVGGFTRMVEKILDGVEVRLGCDYLDELKKAKENGIQNPETLGIAQRVVYTGPIDAFFDYSLGTLQYRSIRLENETLNVDNYQGNAVINYTDKETPFTRIVEHKHFEFAQRYHEDGSLFTEEENAADPKTIISREYSAEWKIGIEPYYPVNDESNNALYAKYRALAEKESRVVFGGRLGEYKYYDMDAVIRAALDKVKEEIC